MPTKEACLEPSYICCSAVRWQCDVGRCISHNTWAIFISNSFLASLVPCRPVWSKSQPALTRRWTRIDRRDLCLCWICWCRASQIERLLFWESCHWWCRFWEMNTAVNSKPCTGVQNLFRGHNVAWKPLLVFFCLLLAETSLPLHPDYSWALMFDSCSWRSQMIVRNLIMAAATL